MTPPAGERPLDIEERRALYRSLLERASTVAGVEAASASVSGLFSRGVWRNAIDIEGFVPPPGVTLRSFANAVSPDYFEVMRMRVLRGRPFAATDRASTARVAIVNQTFANQFSAAPIRSAGASASARASRVRDRAAA